jgi:thioredoxin-like negative regulator of GroEL
MKEVTETGEIKKLMRSEEPVAIFYYSATCGHCKVMHTPWKNLEEEDQGKTAFYKMESANIPSEFGIMGYPHFVLVKNGSVVKTTSGEMSQKDLKEKLFGGSGVGLAFANGGRRRRARTRRLRRRVRKVAHRTLRH